MVAGSYFKGVHKMKLIKTEEFLKIENPTPGDAYRPLILTGEDNAKEMAGRFCLNEPGAETQFHWHDNETIRVVISGEGTHITLTDAGQEVETPIKAGDLLYIPAGEKHRLVNRHVRFFEFFTNPPMTRYPPMPGYANAEKEK